MTSLRWLPIALAALALCGCTAQYQPRAHRAGDEIFRSPVWTTDGLYLVDIAGPGVLFMTHPMTSLSRYTGLLIDDIEVRSKEGNTELLPHEADWLGNYIRRALQRVLVDSDLEFVDQPGSDVLRMRISVSDVEFRRIYVDSGGSATLNPSGGFSVVLELRDSVEEGRLMLFSERRPLPVGVYFGPGLIEFERLQDALDDFTRDVRVHLVAARNGALPSPQGPRP